MLDTASADVQGQALTTAIEKTRDQLERLETMLHQARFKRTEEYELHLRIEEKIQSTVRLLLELQERQKPTPSHGDHPAASITAVILDALEGYPEAKMALHDALQPSGA